jgi:hypothetical protein
MSLGDRSELAPFLDALHSARKAHSEWKVRFTRALDEGHGDAFDPKLIARDDQCPLGRWLHSAELPEVLRATPEFAAALEQHREFHLEASEVAGALKARNLDLARRSIHPGSGFDRASLALVKTLLDWTGRLNRMPSPREPVVTRAARPARG